MQKKYLLWLIVAFLLLSFQVGAWSQATMSGKLLAVDGARGLVTIQLDSGAKKQFKLEPDAQVEWFGEKTTLSALPIGQKIAVRIAGALNAKPLHTDLIVDWNGSGAYVAKTAKAPYHTKVGDYATAGGASATMPAGAGMNASAAMQAPGSTVPMPGMQMNSNGHFVNQGALLQAPLSATATQSRPQPISNTATPAAPTAPATSVANPAGIGYYPGGLTNPSAQAPARSADPFGMGGDSYSSAAGGNSFPAMVVQVNSQGNTVTLQPQGGIQPFTISLLQVEADPMALQIGTSVQVLGRSTPQGFVVEKLSASQLNHPEF